MYKRKVNLVGSNTLTVSLPSKWTSRMHLSKGDEITLIEKNNSLTITKENVIENKGELSLHLSNDDEFTQRFVTNPYARGVDSLTITFENHKTLYLIEEALSKTIGFEIIKQDRNKVVIKNILGDSNEDFNNILERLYFIILTGIDDLCEQIKLKDFDFKFLEKISSNSDKYELLGRRIMNLQGFADRNKQYSIYSMLRNYELIGDILKDISNLQIKNKISNEDIKEIVSSINKATQLIKAAHKLFHKHNFDNINKYNKLKKELKSTKINHYNNINSNELKFISFKVYETIKIINHIAEEALFLNEN